MDIHHEQITLQISTLENMPTLREKSGSNSNKYTPAVRDKLFNSMYVQQNTVRTLLIFIYGIRGWIRDLAHAIQGFHNWCTSSGHKILFKMLF